MTGEPKEPEEVGEIITWAMNHVTLSVNRGTPVCARLVQNALMRAASEIRELRERVEYYRLPFENGD